MPPVGIGIATFRRPDSLQRALDAVSRHTRAPYELVVADDGSGDGTVDACGAAGVRVVTGDNRRVAWNKNRALFALSLLGCDPVLVLEDDVYPVLDGWEEEWLESTRRWHHVAFLHPKLAQFNLAGAGTAADPFVNPRTTAQCLSVSAQALARVGFMDSRFTGWGHEHVEWTMRLKQAGYGHREVALPGGANVSGHVYVSGGLEAADVGSHRNRPEAAAGLDTFRDILGDPVFRYPWSDEDQRQVFLAEQSAAGLPAAPAPGGNLR